MTVGGLLVSLLGAVVLLACIPTEPCACPPALTYAILFGEVRRGDGTPSQDRLIATVLARPNQSTTCDLTPPLEEPYPPTMRTDPSGRFRVQLFSPYGPGVRCVRIVGYLGERGTSDSTFADLLLTFRFQSERADSTGIVLVLPE